jgi:type II secretory pathway pseudopilin PulG
VGFTLIETLIANGIVLAVALGVAQLFAMTTDANRRAALQTWMTLCAVQKLEELRTVEAAGLSGVEHLDSSGAVVPASNAAYVRRWSIEPLASHPDSLLVTSVVVTFVARPVETQIVGVHRRGG